MEYKFGKLPVRIDKRTILLSQILTAEIIPLIPSSFDTDSQYPSLIDNNMYLNDKLGDCVIAGRGHQTLRFEEFEQNVLIPINDDDIRTEYFKETSGDDSGLEMLTSLNAWRKGWKAAGKVYSIYAYAALNLKDHSEIKAAVYLLNGVYAGFNVPQSAINQFKAGKIWDVVENDGGIAGGHCFTGDTKIALLNGQDITLKELAENYADKEFWVYSLDDKQNIVPGKGRLPRLTRKNAKIIKIILDNNESVRCTEDHLFLMRDNTYKKACELNGGDRLMPLYRRKGQLGYETVLNPANQKYALTHGVVTNNLLGIKPIIADDRIVVHHKDFNKYNNAPENLMYMSWKVHTALHNNLIGKRNQTARAREISRQNMIKLWSNVDWREKMLAKKEAGFLKYVGAGNKTGFALWDTERLKEQGHIIGKKYGVINGKKNAGKKHPGINVGKIPWNKGLNKENNAKILQQSENKKEWWRNKKKETVINHKVLSVEGAGYEDVYDFEVEKYHNFALSAGVFVHNCVFIVGYNSTGPVCITWGKKQQMTWAFWEKYFDEAYGVVDNADNWVTNDPIDIAKLDGYLNAICAAKTMTATFTGNIDNKSQSGEKVTIVISKSDGSKDTITTTIDKNGNYTTQYLCSVGTYTAHSEIQADSQYQAAVSPDITFTVQMSGSDLVCDLEVASV